MEDPTNLFCSDFNKLVRCCIAYYEKNRNHKGAREKKAALSYYVKEFHEDCDTLTPSVKKRIEDLRQGNCVVLMTAHQPNFFPYSGVFRKATLNFVLARKLETELGVPIINFFGLADQDFIDDRWVRTLQLPAVARTTGILNIEMKTARGLRLNAVAKPSHELLARWKTDMEQWLEEETRSVESISRLNFPESFPADLASGPRNNLNSLWNIVQECHDRCKTYSDFNAFQFSKIVNDEWGYDTVFARFSQCQKILAEEFAFLLSNFNAYAAALRETMQSGNFEKGVSKREPELVPFWHECCCGSKVRLVLAEKDRVLSGTGNCVRCGRHYDLEFGPKENPCLCNISSKISARSVAMNLAFFKSLMPCCYVGGLAGAEYLTQARRAAEALDIPFPPIAIWRPHDRYLGLGQLDALLQVKQISGRLGARDYSSAIELLGNRRSEAHDRIRKLDALKKEIAQKLKESPDDGGLKEEMVKASVRQTAIKKESELSLVNRELALLKNIPAILDLIPSIVDYAVNVGLRETSEQWIRYLCENGDLSSDLQLESILSRDDAFCQNLSADYVFHSNELSSKFPMLA
jgi:hypothetical protein